MHTTQQLAHSCPLCTTTNSRIGLQRGHHRRSAHDPYDGACLCQIRSFLVQTVRTSVIMEICQKIMIPCAPSFKVTETEYRHRLIGYLWLPISVPYRFWEKWQCMQYFSTLHTLIRPHWGVPLRIRNSGRAKKTWMKPLPERQKSVMMRYYSYNRVGACIGRRWRCDMSISLPALDRETERTGKTILRSASIS